MKKIICRTPLECNRRLSQKWNSSIYLKREDLQTIRSFKIRGAYQKIINTINKNTGFVSASAGNHAQGVAYSCYCLGLESHIFVPENTPRQKIARIEYFGGDLCKLYKYGKDFDECLEESQNFCDLHNKTFVHPFDDLDVIKGQSTVVKEILEDIQPDTILCGVGGGGLLAGTIQGIEDNVCNVIGVEPSGATSMKNSIEKGEIVSLESIDSFVDGASVKRVGDHTFTLSKERVSEMVAVSNGHICNEMIELYQNEGIIAEPAGVLSICGLDKIDPKYIINKKVVCILSGGNNDIMRYPEIVEKSLRYRQLQYYFIIDFKQTPGELKRYVFEVLVENTDITRFEYIKKNNKGQGSVLLGIQVETVVQIEIIKKNMMKNRFHYIEITEDDLLYDYLI